jgi:uncharacterized protein (TIGR00255 family)
MTSMTGHGRGEAATKAWGAVVECHSVNRKNAEVVFHSDRGAAWLEPLVRDRVLAKISRGRVQVNLELESRGAGGAQFFDEDRAGAFVRSARALAQKLGIPGEITIADVLAAPGVARAAEPDSESARGIVLKALDAALAGLLATRCREGAALGKALAKSVDRLDAIARKIAPLAGKSAEIHRAALLKRIGRAGLGIRNDDPRLATEVALFAERCDTTEELHRIASHTAQFREKLASPAPVGRTLEFIAQELGREFNTLGAKSPSAAISRLVIDAKSELDRIREQLANIE